MTEPFTLTLRCPERSGLGHAVTAFLAGPGCDLVEHQQFDDDVRGSLFLRTGSRCGESTVDELARASAPVAGEFGREFRICGAEPDRVLAPVSKVGHCLDDLRFRWRSGSLGARIRVLLTGNSTVVFR
ncbi:hypothetical protein [Amycolatopsis sp. PS_44_ISF1]|uniref:hypothetical protein n=1 Tax=Amycolatopsis sp. PS_44_ISF1 TaxID=2974917 RepID=UPI0028DFD510|nr:hypothetical protein [Amycolatopsis sp. PS_44_ISF1]MDT8912880.1 hypothetical protein [Amycolatopsis sp. PS_44_ISF1]